jgi:hypothetical protein
MRVCLFRFLSLELVNRRLDEWVPEDRFAFDTIENPKNKEKKEKTETQENRKLTRNLKRKYEEINHVQKVFAHACSHH